MRARSLTCGSCGGRTRIEHGATEAVCVHCGQPVRLSQALMEEQANAAAFPPTTPIHVGMTALWEGKTYEVWSRTVMRQVDEGITYQWEEFLLVAPDGDLRYLEYDEGKFKLSQPFTPSEVPDPRTLDAAREGATLALDGRQCSVSDSGLATVAYFEGEFPWTVSLHQQKRFVDAQAFGRFYSIEWSADAIEYYQGRPLDERQIYTMFDLRPLLEACDKRDRVLRGRRVFAWTCLATALACFIGWMVALTGGGRAVGQGAAQIVPTGEAGRRFGPFQLSAKDRVYRLELRGNMREQSNWVQAVLEDEQEAELFETNRDMWDESGRDSDGAWHESDLSSNTNFVINKPGPYYVRLYMEPEPGQVGKAPADVQFVLRQGVMYPLYFALMGFALLVIGIIWLARSSASVQARLWEQIPDPTGRATVSPSA